MSDSTVDSGKRTWLIASGCAGAVGAGFAAFESAGYAMRIMLATQEMKAKFPLRAAQIKVEEIPGSPGSYNAVAWLRPWLQLEELTTSLRMVAKIPADGYDRFRADPELKPGQVYPIAFDVGWISQVFNKGHRIRVTVCSTGAEFYEPHPNTADTYDRLFKVYRNIYPALAPVFADLAEATSP